MGQPDIVLVILDTARADAFSPWGGVRKTPVMQRLFEEGLAYRRAMTQAPWTLPSTASLFSGKLPTEHLISGESMRWVNNAPTSPRKVIRRYRDTWLPKAMRQRGYETWGASCNPWVSRWSGFGLFGFRKWTDFAAMPHASDGGKARRERLALLLGRRDKGGERVAESFAQFLGGVDGAGPIFAFMNLMEMHAPYGSPRPHYPYSTIRRLADPRLRTLFYPELLFNAGVQQPPSGLTKIMKTLYFAQASYADLILGRIVRTIRDNGRPTVLMVVGDHGENLGEDGLFNHDSSLSDRLLHVPFVAWGQGVDLGPAVVDEPVSLQGVTPWLLGIADGGGEPIRPGSPILSEYESTTRQRRIPEAVSRAVEAGTAPTLLHRRGLAVRDGSLKYLATEDGNEQVFDTRADPAERHDILARQPEAALPFRPFRDQWLERLKVEGTSYAPELFGWEEATVAENLRFLGYIE